MSNVETLFPLETVSETVLLIESQTPAAPSTDQTRNTETTVTMPKAIDSRNDTFITDQGSMRLSRRRARRGARAGAPVVRRAAWRPGTTGTATVSFVSAAGWAVRWVGSVAGRGATGAGAAAAGRSSVRWLSSAGIGGSTRDDRPLEPFERRSSEAAMRRWRRSARGIRAVS